MAATTQPALPRSTTLVLALSLLAAACGDKDDEDLDGDGFSAAVDCDDLDATVGAGLTFYGDVDGDGYAGEELVVEVCEAPAGYSEAPTDCDDLDAAVHPAASEVCDGLDNDCDGLVDDADDDWDSSTGGAFYPDEDGDGYGVDDGAPVPGCEAPEGYAAEVGDCDDTDPDVSPATPWYPDYDGDGYGDPDLVVSSCEQPPGYLAEGGDCDDTDPEVNPDGLEVCDGVDNDCDGEADDEDPEVDTSTYQEFWPDGDGDGYGEAGGSAVEACAAPEGYAGSEDDCDDGDSAVNPGATEVCNDGLDNDCDGGPGPCAITGDLGTETDADVHVGGADVLDSTSRGLAAVGDVDGDGLVDVILGGDLADEPETTAGSAWLLHGSTSLSGEVDITTLPAVTGSESYAYFGHRVAGGDLDGDGLSDVLISAYGQDSPSTSDAGAAYLFYGGTTAFDGSSPVSEDVADAVFYGASEDDYLGQALWGAGDLDGDGYEDLLLGAEDWDGDGTDDTGVVFLLYGSASAWSGEHDAVDLPGVVGARIDDKLSGAAGLSAGDFDGDGHLDLAVGAWGRTVSLQADAGVVYVFEGDGSQWTGQVDTDDADQALLGYGSDLGDLRFGAALDAAGDVNADGYEDLVVGALYADGVGDKSGAVFAYLGTATGWGTSLGSHQADLVVEGDAEQDYLGRAVSAGGDLDGDGFDDILMGAYQWDGSYSNGGGVFAVLGSSSFGGALSIADLDTRMGGQGGNLNLGYTVDAADVNGDGYSDVLAGALYDDDLGGGLYIFFGGGL